MGGFLAGIGKGILERSAANRLANRYRPQTPPQMMGPHPVQSQDQTDEDIANMNAIQPENDARGKLITKPTIARLGESGPEAVIPLNNKAGNRVTPDLMEGHLMPPKVPGVRYQNFKGYIKPSY